MSEEGIFWIRDDDTPEYAEKVICCLDISPLSYSEYNVFLPKPPVGVALKIESQDFYENGTPLLRFYYEAYHTMQWALDEGLIEGQVPPMDSYEDPELPENVVSITEGLDDDADQEDEGGEEEEPF